MSLGVISAASLPSEDFADDPALGDVAASVLVVFGELYDVVDQVSGEDRFLGSQLGELASGSYVGLAQVVELDRI
jgi:hypothetical protein